MNVTTATVAPPSATLPPIRIPPGSHDYLFIVGFFCTVLLLISITYTTYRCKHSRSPPPPPPPPRATTFDYRSDDNLVRLSRGLDDDVLVTFPTFVYSETKKSDHKFDSDTTDSAAGSGCTICLEDYKLTDIVRLFPECGHLFHVRCIDIWLKAHPTCPVCRKFASISSTES